MATRTLKTILQILYYITLVGLCLRLKRIEDNKNKVLGWQNANLQKSCKKTPIRIIRKDPQVVNKRSTFQSQRSITVCYLYRNYF